MSHSEQDNEDQDKDNVDKEPNNLTGKHTLTLRISGAKKKNSYIVKNLYSKVTT